MDVTRCDKNSSLENSFSNTALLPSGVGPAIYLAVLWVVVDGVAIPCYKVAPTVSLIVGKLAVDNKVSLLLL